MTRSKAASFAVVIAALALLAWPGAAQARVIERESISSAGIQANDRSSESSVSGDGRYVAFQSAADNLVAGDANLAEDIFVRDRQTGTTVLVSVASNGTQGNGPSTFPRISADGAWVAFTSAADNLVADDTNGVPDVFLHEMATGATTRISVASDGTEGDDESGYPYVCADGSVVAFSSFAANLVPGDTNYDSAAGIDGEDIFVWVRASGNVERMSVDSSAVEGNDDSLWPCLSADGRYVCFNSYSTNLVAGDNNEAPDVFVRDRTGGTTERVSVANDGAEGDDWSDYPSISADGRYVAFDSQAGNLVAGDDNYDWDVFVRDRTGGTTTRVSVSGTGSQGNLNSFWPSISGDGRYVVFESFATDLVSGATSTQGDVYVRDRTGGTTTRLSVTSAGVQGNDWSGTPAISADGRYVVFESEATNLITPDSNADASDVFAVINPATVTYDSYRGTDRYDTAIKLSKAANPTPLPAGSGLVIAPGETFPEALCGAPLAAAWGGPVLLHPKTGLNTAVVAEVKRLAPSRVFLIGYATTQANRIKAALPGITISAINGTDVYDMSYKVAKALRDKVGDLSAATAIITIGTNYPDALGVSPLACAKKWPILLTNPSGRLNAKAAQALSELGITQALKVGTYVTLPTTVAGRANLSGANRYITNANVAAWAQANAGLTFTHTAIATGDKFPDALAAGPYLAKDSGILLLSPLYGPLPAPIGALLTANRDAVQHFTFVAMVEPVIGQVKALLP
jgi:Tol biopolymer transport system component/putative cell wall-binding protein